MHAGKEGSSYQSCCLPRQSSTSSEAHVKEKLPACISRAHLQKASAVSLQHIPLPSQVHEDPVIMLLEGRDLACAVDYTLHLCLLGLQGVLQLVHLTLEALLLNPTQQTSTITNAHIYRVIISFHKDLL